MEGVSRHVGHDGLHRDLLSGRKSNLPCFLEFQGRCFLCGWRFPAHYLRLLEGVSKCSSSGRRVPTCFPVTDLAAESPGGSGILLAFLGLAGRPLFNSTTHLGCAVDILSQLQGRWRQIGVFCSVDVQRCCTVTLHVPCQCWCLAAEDEAQRTCSDCGVVYRSSEEHIADAFRPLQRRPHSYYYGSSCDLVSRLLKGRLDTLSPHMDRPSYATNRLTRFVREFRPLST